LGVTCIHCGKPMKLLDEVNQKWYCFTDDELYYAKQNHWGPLPESDSPVFKRYSRGDVVHNAITGLFTGGFVGAVGGALKATQYNEDATVRADLLKKLISDAQYEDAFKEWWVRTFPKKTYEREAFVYLTKEYVDSGIITLKKNEVKFSGAAKLVGKLYQMKKTVSDKSFCIECGNELTPKSKFCHNCGTKQP